MSICLLILLCVSLSLVSHSGNPKYLWLNKVFYLWVILYMILISGMTCYPFMPEWLPLCFPVCQMLPMIWYSYLKEILDGMYVYLCIWLYFIFCRFWFFHTFHKVLGVKWFLKEISNNYSMTWICSQIIIQLLVLWEAKIHRCMDTLVCFVS